MPPGSRFSSAVQNHRGIKGSLGFKGPRRGCLRCLPEALDIAPPPSPATGKPGSRALLGGGILLEQPGCDPQAPAKLSVRLRVPQVRAAPRRLGPRRRIWSELVRAPDTAGHPTTERGAPAGRARAPPGPVRLVPRSPGAGPRLLCPPVPCPPGSHKRRKGCWHLRLGLSLAAAFLPRSTPTATPARRPFCPEADDAF